jgi:hypothetical protein
VGSKSVMSKEYDFKIWQDGILVARVLGTNLDQVKYEVRHYVGQYIQDGMVEVRGRNIADLDMTFAH